MTMTSTPLTVLDLVPISSGSTAGQALRNSIDLARQAERLGYARYWFAEHHLNPGVAGTSPAVVLALTAGATSSIRLGSGAVQMGHRTALSTVEEFGLLDAAYPGRFDLGLGRSGGRREPKAPALAGRGAAATVVDGRAPNGLLIPPKFNPASLLKSPPHAPSQWLTLRQPLPRFGRSRNTPCSNAPLRPSTPTRLACNSMAEHPACRNTMLPACNQVIPKRTA